MRLSAKLCGGLTVAMTMCLLMIVASARSDETPLAVPEPDVSRTLWYSSAAPLTDAGWEQNSLPVGNGSIGGSVHGGVGTERLTLNADTLWTGGPGSQEGYTFGNWPTPRPNAMANVQQQIRDNITMGNSAVASALGNPAYSSPGPGHIRGFGAYQVFGEMNLTVPGTAGFSNYRRSLDIGDALAKVRYTAGGTEFNRTHFASYPDDVVVSRFDANQPGTVSFTLGFSSPHSPAVVSSLDSGQGRIAVTGTLASSSTSLYQNQGNDLKYEMQLIVVADGGTVTAPSGQLTVTNANSATVYLSMGTDYAQDYPVYRGPDPHAEVLGNVNAAAAKGYDLVLSDHLNDYRGLFDRNTLDIGGVMPSDTQTSTLRSNYQGNGSATDKALETLMYDYGRYLLISSSRPGSLPANLQGIWNRSTSPPWEADYHTNINVQMNYWLAEQTNLSEVNEPLMDFIESLVEPGRVTSQNVFGTDGWMVSQNTNIFGFTGFHDWDTSFWMPDAAGWLMRHVWEKYEYTQDLDFLASRGYPMMKEAAQFWLENLIVDQRDGKLVVSPSYSPEHGQYSAGTAMSQQIVTDLLTNTLAAAKELNADPAFQSELEAALNQMDPGLRVGSWGNLMEWKHDDPNDYEGNTHRHVSQLFALHPGNAINVREDPTFANAARTTLNSRGDGGTGWSQAWKVNFWARLLDGSRAQKVLSDQIKSSTLPNLWGNHPPFQMDANFGATAGIAEMFVQSHNGVIDLLPALPANWPSGSMTGLAARGDIEVSVEFEGGQLTRAELVGGEGAEGEHTVRSPIFQRPLVVRDVSTGENVAHETDGPLLTLSVGEDQVIEIVPVGTLSFHAPSSVNAGRSLVSSVTLGVEAGHGLEAGNLTIEAPDGWQVFPQSVTVPAISDGETFGPVEFRVHAPGNAVMSVQLTAKWQAGDGESELTGTQVVDVNGAKLACSSMTVTAWSSQETDAENRPASNLVDCVREPGWTTHWSGGISPPPPHWVVFDLGSVTPVAAAGCEGRASQNGRIKDFRLETSLDGSNWTLKAEGVWQDDTSVQAAQMDGASARYIRMTGLNSYRTNEWIACGEFHAWTSRPDAGALEVTIEEGEAALDGAVPGTGPGQYPPEAIDALDSELAQSRALRDDLDATQAALDDQAATLASVLAEFEDSVFPPIPPKTGTSISGKVKPKAIKAGKKGKLSFSVKSKVPAVAVSGKVRVQVLRGKKKVLNKTVTLKPNGSGKLTLPKKKLKPGKHSVKLAYLGNAELNASSKTVKFKVKKAKKKR